MEEAEVGLRLDRYLAARLVGMSRSRVKQLIDEGRVSSDGATIVEASLRVKSSQSFAIDIPEIREAPPEAQALDLSVLYEDAELIVIDKPAGLVVHPAPGNPDHTLVNALIAHCGAELTGIGGERRPGIVHRLDKDTSGVMVAAKTERALHSLTEQFAARSIERAYDAFVWGSLSPPAGEISGNIGRSPRNRKKMAVLRRGGKTAITRYRTIARYAGGTISRLECRLLTGRTHQIRVHLTDAGHSLLGDPVYGGSVQRRMKDLPVELRDAIAELGRQALHARTLGFSHPVSGERLSFQSDLPPDLRNLTTLLELV
ncbi:RluA family pseudouridine synthase [Aquibaculum arenosum]|uniref:Pseudouridine synthase n=1 Tax=Aquibaculum arenosum TaxID=3032591 RepID=A0ABT5YND8_9PROT|nr:RluA family pseudouridine synthase [Fodinicurvata sp. CAU 1616]MDF2096357.1 RluA family pseudouridine synthase [Fodinicurvata sp. CAU 1616]